MRRKLQVFVSSTFTDLINERQAAVAAILKAGHIPAGMELFTAGDKSQMATIEKWIDESDVYMLILGGRYGSVEKNTNLSYTELEFDYAVQQGKPLFSVVISDDYLEEKIRSGGSGFSEKENPKELAQFRSKVLGNISSFFSDEKDIKLCVYESLSDYADNDDLLGWVPASEIPNTEVLQADLRRAADENKALRDEISLLEGKIKSNSTLNITKSANDLDDYNELVDILESIDVTVPANANSEKKKIQSDLLRVFISCKEQLIMGISNNAGMSDTAQFLFFNISPKLQIHGLMATEKVGSTQIRRSATTPKGDKFLAEFERRKARSGVTKPQLEQPTPPEK